MSPAVKSPARGGSSFTPLRIILIVILVVLLGAFFVDWRARNASQNAHAELIKHLPGETDEMPDEAVALLSQAQVNQIVGREPDGPLTEEDGRFVQTFTWQGVPKQYILKVAYGSGSEANLISAELTAAGDLLAESEDEAGAAAK